MSNVCVVAGSPDLYQILFGFQGSNFEVEGFALLLTDRIATGIQVDQCDPLGLVGT